MAEICHRLDGLPLAIELAVARVRLFAPEALLARLSSRLTVLTGGARDLPARQQTIRATIDWSYNLLDDGEKTLFARLGVFVGGCALEAAEAVCNVRGDLPIEIVDGLGALVDKSLLHQNAEPDREPRFTMLETVREYALERLGESGEEAALRRRRAEYYLALAEQAEQDLWGAQQVAWIDRLEREFDNLRAVFAWSLAAADAADLGIRLAQALTTFWVVRGHQHEVRAWLGRILLMRQNLSKSAQGAALYLAADLESLYGDSVLARALSDEAIALYRELGDPAGLAWALVFAGRIARGHGDYARAATLEEEGLRLYQEQGNRREIKWAFFSLGDVALDQGNHTSAAERFQQALALAREQGNEHEVGLALVCLGQVAYAQNDAMRAQTLLAQALALFQNLGEQGGMAAAQFELGRVAQLQGDTAQAAALFAKSLLLFQAYGDKWGLVDAFQGLAMVAGDRRQPEHAARLFGAAEALRESIGHPLPPIMRAEYDQAVAAARAQLDADAFATAWAAGRAMTIEEAITLALEEEG